MITCPRCGFQAPDGSLFCPRCGYGQQRASVPAAPPAVTVTCPKCGAVLSPDANFCPACGLPRSSAANSVVSGQSKLLLRVVGYYSQKGFRVTSQTDTTAQLLRPKQFNGCLAVFLFILAVLPFVIYLIYYLTSSDTVLYITVNPDLSVTFVKNDDKPITTRYVNDKITMPAF